MDEFDIEKLKEKYKYKRFYHLNTDKEIKNTKPKCEKNICIHDVCKDCSGTGINKDTGAACIHFLSCPCRRCNTLSF